MPGVTIIGGVDNPAREGLVSLTVDGVPALDVVEALNSIDINPIIDYSPYHLLRRKRQRAFLSSKSGRMVS
jgi:hypothetical protein